MQLSLQPISEGILEKEFFAISSEKASLTVGRSAGNDLIVNHASVSAIHARLEVSSGDQIEVHDLQSSNGTFVNGQQIENRVLEIGDLLKFASAEFEVVETKEDPAIARAEELSLAIEEMEKEQAELKLQCSNLKSTRDQLIVETSEHRATVRRLDGELEKVREKVDREVRRSQGLSRSDRNDGGGDTLQSKLIANDREKAVFQELIERIEGLDQLVAGYRKSKSLKEVVIELELFRGRLNAILEKNGVESYEIEPKTQLTLKHRATVQIVSKKGWGTKDHIEALFQPGVVTKVVRPGFRVGSEDNPVILRKVEVLIREVNT